jgi:hypothetical protein
MKDIHDFEKFGQTKKDRLYNICIYRVCYITYAVFLICAIFLLVSFDLIEPISHEAFEKDCIF